MTQMTLEIPQTLLELPENERLSFLQAGLYEAGRARIRQLRREVTEAEEQIRQFEQRYGVALSRFETEILPKADTFQEHDDYNDWVFWHSVLVDKQSLLTKLSRVQSA